MNRSFRQSSPGLLLAVLLLAGCAGPRFSQDQSATGDANSDRLSQLARAAYDRGSLAQAETLYREAQRHARALDDAADVADASYNLAAVLMARGQMDAARSPLEEAEAAARRAGQTPTDVWLLQAKLALAAHQPAEALRWVEAVNQNASATPTQRMQAALLRGEIACDEQNLPAARAQLELVQHQNTGTSPLMMAGREKLSGRVALLENHPDMAAAAFDREADLFRRAGQALSLAQSLTCAGEAFAAAGDPRPAAERTYQAARSFFAQGNLPAARQSVERARHFASLAADAGVTQRVESLAAEIERANH